MLFDAVEGLLFNIVVKITENEGPKGCLKRVEKAMKIIEIHYISVVSGKLLWMVLSADGCCHQAGLAGWPGVDSRKYWGYDQIRVWNRLGWL